MKTVALGEIASFTSGGTPSRSRPEFYEGDIPWITGADIAEDESIAARSFITRAAVAGSATQVLPSGTIVLVTRTSVGKVGVLREPTAFCQDITGITPSPDVDGGYLVHYLRMSANGLARLARGATIKGVTRDAVASLQLLLPPLPEQRRIAAILDQADALRAKPRQVFAHLDDLIQSIFRESLRSDDPVEPLGDNLSFVTSGGRGWAKYYAASGDRFIQSLDVRMGTINDRDPVFVEAPDNAEARRTRAQAGDVLLTITGSRIGRVAALPKELAGAYVSQHVAILRPDPKALRADYLSSTLSLPDLGQRLIGAQQYGQTKPGLNFEQIRGFALPRPSLERQDEFLSRKARVDNLKERMSTNIAQTDALFDSLRSRAFQGEL